MLRIAVTALVVALAAPLACTPPAPPDGGTADGAGGDDAGMDDAGVDDAGIGGDGGVDAGAVPTDNSCTGLTPQTLPSVDAAPPSWTSRELQLDVFETNGWRLSPDGHFALLENSIAQQTLLVDVDTGAWRSLPALDQPLIRGAFSARFTPDGQRVVMQDYDSYNIVVQPTSLDAAATMIDIQGILVAFSPVDDTAVFASTSDGMGIVDLATGEHRVLLPDWRYVLYARFTDDGAGLVASTYASEWAAIDLSDDRVTNLGTGAGFLDSLTNERFARLDNATATLNDHALDGSDTEEVLTDVRLVRTGADGSVYVRPSAGGPLRRWRRGEGVTTLSRDVPDSAIPTADGDTLLYLRGDPPDVELRAVDGTGAREAPWLLLADPLAATPALQAASAQGRDDVFLARELTPGGRQLVRRTQDGCSPEEVIADALVCSTLPIERRDGSLYFVEGCPGPLTIANGAGTTQVLDDVRELVLAEDGTRALLRLDDGTRWISGEDVPADGGPLPTLPCGATVDGGPAELVHDGGLTLSSFHGARELRRAGVTRVSGDLRIYGMFAGRVLDLSCLERVDGQLLIQSTQGARQIDLSSVTELGSLDIEYNQLLSEVDLSSLATVEGDVIIQWNNTLRQCDAEALVEQVTVSGTTSIQGKGRPHTVIDSLPGRYAHERAEYGLDPLVHFLLRNQAGGEPCARSKSSPWRCPRSWSRSPFTQATRRTQTRS
jgi:hypothetical protein